MKTNKQGLIIPPKSLQLMSNMKILYTHAEQAQTSLYLRRLVIRWNGKVSSPHFPQPVPVAMN